MLSFVPLESVCDSIATATPVFKIGNKRVSIILLAAEVKVALPKFQLIGNGLLSVNSQSTSFQVVNPPFVTKTSLVTVLNWAGTVIAYSEASLTKTTLEIVVYSAGIAIVLVDGGVTITLFLTTFVTSGISTLLVVGCLATTVFL